MSNDWPGDDDELDSALNDEALEELLNTASSQLQQQQQQSKNKESEYDGFNESAGHNWLYPNNLPLRSYQHSIVQASLFRNTLVVLPTGLGKTFIASVVMYNLHRWYPDGKLIFMAPTRPLVSQQITACQKIMPFPPEDTVELTGRLPRAKRAELWMSKRVFFATPQVVQSDMMDTGDGMQFPFNAIKLLVVDEAHRAKGRYAYTQVTESIMARNRNFRMLALSATPGRTMDDVANVCRNLYISHLEVRWDQSIDVQPYIHQRTLRTIVVPLKDAIKEPRARLHQIIDPYLRQLIAADVLKGARGNITRNNLLFDQSRFQEQANHGPRHPEHSLIASNFSMCISLYHSLELLERHGFRVFVNSFDADDRGRDKFVLRDAALRDLVEQTRQQLGANPLDISTRPMTNGEVAPMPAQLDFGHPKYEQARQVMHQHFELHPDSRAIVFCEYRESVMLIQRLLLQHRPVVRPRCFVGQSSSGNGICNLTQKEQLQIMSDFRNGVSNVLVATSIGEEGLDVGEVDLIVCFDICSSNPTRFVQRIGRTGRQRRGQVVMLVTEGREQQLLKEVLANRDQTNRKLLQSTVVKRSLYEYAPRLVPPQFNPKCEQRFMEPPPIAATTSKTPSPKCKARKPAKESAVKCHDLRKFFKQGQDKFLQGEADYQISEKSQQMLQKQMESHRVNVKNFLIDTQTSTGTTNNTSTTNTTGIARTTSTTSTVSCSQEETLRLRKLTRLLQANKPLVSDAQRSQDLVAQLQDKQLPHSLKLYLLKSNAMFVRDVREKMQQQVALQLPEARLNSRQQRTRRIHELVENLCNGQMDQLLQPLSSGAELTLKDLQQPLDVRRQQHFEAACSDIFKDLHEQGVCADNHELVQQQLEQLELRRLEQTMKELEELGNETSCNYDQWEEEEVEEEQTGETSQWQEFAHSSTPVRIKQPEQQQLNDSSIVNSSQLSANLSRLNCVMSAASTPFNQKLKTLPRNSLLDALDENLSDFDQLAEQEEPPKADIAVQETDVMITPDALDIDLNDFLEPLPEEEQLLLQTQKSKENQTPAMEIPILASPERNNSPDLFAEESMSPWRPTTVAVPVKSLAAKLAAKTNKLEAALQSPEQRPRITPVSAEKSPSIFENYLQRMRGRGQLSRAAQRLHSMTSSMSAATSTHNEEEDSPIMRRRPAKRKIYAISDEEEKQEEQEQQEVKMPVPDTQLLDDDSFEQVPATQIDLLTPPRRNSRRKRAKFNSFILQEADQSGSDEGEDENAEHTIGGYLKDSVIVSSGEEDHNDTNAHAMYLQAVRSPLQRPGAFKIPAPRVYHDEYIYSQPVEEEPSQYYPSSFIANDDSSAQEAHDISECPLERAERILKEQRRERRMRKRGGASAPALAMVVAKRRRAIHTIDDSSDEDIK
ncbi:ATP-dependent DNA helicase MPH1 [Drosophila innubila]|uniref:ATP-dependent DNA helicase MPH1 n=1 Tax=Drosophila innubila TaxID=198719 RepID=UPI00148B901A|nr:ATP-dependent DNA helicase MPH1 [Drosophila innubila]